jgi:MFS family permease
MNYRAVSKTSLHYSQWIFLSFFAIFELGSLLCGVATSSNMLIVGRAVAGLGSTGLQNGGLTIIARSLPVEKRAGKSENYIAISLRLTILQRIREFS